MLQCSHRFLFFWPSCCSPLRLRKSLPCLPLHRPLLRDDCHEPSARHFGGPRGSPAAGTAIDAAIPCGRDAHPGGTAHTGSGTCSPCCGRPRNKLVALTPATLRLADDPGILVSASCQGTASARSRHRAVHSLAGRLPRNTAHHPRPRSSRPFAWPTGFPVSPIIAAQCAERWTTPWSRSGQATIFGGGARAKAGRMVPNPDLAARSGCSPGGARLLYGSLGGKVVSG